MQTRSSILVVTYSEIALKGKNRPMFQRRLLNNMRKALAGEPIERINHVESRYLVRLNDPDRAQACVEKLQRVFGIRWISPTVSVDKNEAGPNLEKVCEVAAELAKRDVGNARTFKVDTRRSDRGYPRTSQEVNQIVGFAVGAAIDLPARMSRPDFTVGILVLKERFLVFSSKVEGGGGLPQGTGGRVCVLLSGGIDSPVAAWLLMRRGCRPTCVHFFSGRSYKEADTAKIVELSKILAQWANTPLTVYMVPVVPYEMRAMDHIDDPHDMVMFRRFMVKVSHAIARREDCLALVTGDSLGQVASQTLQNLAAISPDIQLPIFRPLIGMDKEQITGLSKRIGAYETSIEPYRDCCSIRSPKPVLNAKAETLMELSEIMDLKGAVDEALNTSARLVVDTAGTVRVKDLSERGKPLT